MPEREADRDQREQRFGDLYREHYRSVQAYAVRRVESAADAADVVADVFTVAWRRLSEVPGPPADLLWLYGVARRVVAGKRRSARRLRHLAARLRATPAAASASGDELTERVTQALLRLRPAEREVVALVHWEDLSHAEAAQVLGCSANAVAIRLHRARTRLRQLLTELIEPELTHPELSQPQSRRDRAATVIRDATRTTEG